MRLPTLPDAAGICADPGLHYEDLNAAITDGYGRLGWHAQAVVEPGWSGEPTGQRPTWFGIAPYASREVGRGQLAAGAAVRGLDHLEATVGEAPRLLQVAVPDLSDGLADELAAVLRRLDRDAVRVGAFLLRLAGGGWAAPQVPGNLNAMLDPRLLGVATTRMLGLLATCPDASLTDRLERVARTARNLLADGNRRIFSDIGVAGANWLSWRHARGAQPEPEDVLAELRLGPDDDVEAVRRSYARVMRAVDLGALPQRFDVLAPGAPTLVPAFALYEAARLDPIRRMELITVANTLVAWQEQRVSVQPAFTPGATLDGEVDRVALFDVLTATIQLPIPARRWRFSAWADQHLGRRDLNPLTPRVSEYNWSAFEDRWRPILGAFDDIYTRPDDVFPAPVGDPRVHDPRGA